jgi:hypothetical protein
MWIWHRDEMWNRDTAVYESSRTESGIDQLRRPNMYKLNRVHYRNDDYCMRKNHEGTYRLYEAIVLLLDSGIRSAKA